MFVPQALPSATATPGIRSTQYFLTAIVTMTVRPNLCKSHPMCRRTQEERAGLSGMLLKRMCKQGSCLVGSFELSTPVSFCPFLCWHRKLSVLLCTWPLACVHLHGRYCPDFWKHHGAKLHLWLTRLSYALCSHSRVPLETHDVATHLDRHWPALLAPVAWCIPLHRTFFLPTPHSILTLMPWFV